MNIRDGLPSNVVERSDLRRSRPAPTDLRRDTTFNSDPVTLALTSREGFRDIRRFLTAAAAALALSLSTGRRGLGDDGSCVRRRQSARCR